MYIRSSIETKRDCSDCKTHTQTLYPSHRVLVRPVTFALAIRKDWMWFIANFCMLANGAYIATAWVFGDRYLDTPKLLEHGARPISIAIYSILTIGFGYIGFRRQCVRVLSPEHVGATTVSSPNIIA